MSLMKNRYALAFAATAALLVGIYLCTVSVVWAAVFCVAAPMLLSYTLQRFGADRDYTEEYEDPEWNLGKY